MEETTMQELIEDFQKIVDTVVEVINAFRNLFKSLMTSIRLIFVKIFSILLPLEYKKYRHRKRYLRFIERHYPKMEKQYGRQY